jgi:hypothetical protein
MLRHGISPHRLEDDVGTIDKEQVAELLGRFVNDLGATISAGNVLIGDKLGLYQTLAEAGPLTPASWRSTPRPQSGMFANGCPVRQRVATSRTTPRPAGTR